MFVSRNAVPDTASLIGVGRLYYTMLAPGTDVEMRQNGSIRLILETPASPELVEAYRKDDREQLKTLLNQRFDLERADYTIGDLPSLSFTFKPGPAFPNYPDVPPAPLPDRLVFGILFQEVGAAREFIDAVSLTKDLLVGTDALIASFDSWCPSESSPSFFGTRALAHDLINASVLAATFPPMEGQGVNAVVVDEGFLTARLQVRHPGFAYGGGWIVNQPGMPPRQPGMPVDPDGHEHHGWAEHSFYSASRAAVRLSNAARAHHERGELYGLGARPTSFVLATIALWRALNLVAGSWVFSNAWGIYDRRLEALPGSYTNNANHPYNLQVMAADVVRHDQVYAAGNCGLFCPNLRCGPGDQGPGQSILGANSHPRVYRQWGPCAQMGSGWATRHRGRGSPASHHSVAVLWRSRTFARQAISLRIGTHISSAPAHRPRAASLPALSPPCAALLLWPACRRGRCADICVTAPECPQVRRRPGTCVTATDFNLQGTLGSILGVP